MSSEPDCPQVCPSNYSLMCQDNSSSGDGRPPSAVCSFLGVGYKFFGVGSSRGITCCRCELGAIRTDDGEADSPGVAVNEPVPKFILPEGDTPYVGACPYPSGCGPACGSRFRNAAEPDCPQVCPSNYSFACQDNSSSGDGRPPSAVCSFLGVGYKLVGVGSSRGITCCRCELGAIRTDDGEAESPRGTANESVPKFMMPEGDTP